MNTHYTPGTKVTCPCCAKSVKVTKAGALANHGYRAGNMYTVTAGAQCSAGGATSEQEALTAQAAAAQLALNAAVRIASEKPSPRNLQNVELASRNLVAARKAAGIVDAA